MSNAPSTAQLARRANIKTSLSTPQSTAIAAQKTKINSVFTKTGLITNMQDLFMWFVVLTMIELVIIGYVIGCKKEKFSGGFSGGKKRRGAGIMDDGFVGGTKYGRGCSSRDDPTKKISGSHHREDEDQTYDM